MGDALKKSDIPTVVIDLDMLDPSVASREEVMARLEEFFEKVEEARK